MATILQMTEALINAHRAGDAESAKALAKAIKERRARLPQEKPMDPTEGMSTLDKVVAGFGKSFMDVKRAVMDSPEEVDEARRLDAPLMDTTAGKVGSVAGTISQFAPLAMVPFANTLLGSVAVGGVAGALQPVGSKDSRLNNIAMGGALGGAVPAAMLAGKTAKALAWDPFRKSGQEAIAGRVLEQFALDPRKVNAAVGKTSVLGTKPTLAELAGDDGISQLQRTLMTQNPQTAARLSSRAEANNAVRIGVLEDIAGTGGRREAAEGARSAAASVNYQQAFNAGIDNDMAKALAPQIKSIMARPSVQQAIALAKRIAKEEGVKLDKMGSVKGLHYIKKALDDMLDSGSQTGMGNITRRAIVQTKDDLLTVLDEISPAYKAAREAFEEASKPINQMQVGQRLLDKTTSALRDFSGNPKLYGESYARALRNEADTVAKATGFKGAKGLESVMTPAQTTKLRAIENELSAFAAAREGGKVSGSPTAQYLVGQDILRKTAGPIGLPQKWIEGQFAQNFGARPFTAAYRVPEERIMGLLGDAMLDPQIAATLLAKANQKGALQTVIQNNPKIKTVLEVAAAGAQVAPLSLLPAQR